jgi:tripartite-type tricarboxylate transporter receptor subunit TctC
LNTSCKVAAMLLALCASQAGLAQGAFPTKPIRVIVVFPPGGSADVIARLAAPVMAEKLGQPVVIDNRPGAGGNIGIDAVAKAAPDGYTLGWSGAGALGINSSLYTKMTFDPLKDLAPIGVAAAGTFVLVAPVTSKDQNIADLIASARARPDSLSIGHGGQGTMMHLSAELFDQTAKIQAVMVPYKGTAPATIDAMAGQVPLAVSDIPSALAYIQSGRLKALAVTSLQRSESLPDVPTLAESGLPGYEAVGWFGVVAPAGTPPAVIDRLNKALNESLNRPDIKEKIIGLGMEPGHTSPDEFGRFMKTEADKWGKIVQKLGLRVD